MTTVPSPTDNASTHYYESSPFLPKETLSIADQPQMAPGETESRIKTEETLSRNLSLLQREQALIAQYKTVNHAHEKFPLAADLFKIYIERFNLAGLSVQEFAAEVKQNPPTQCFEGAHSNLKNNLQNGYLLLVGLANEVKALPYTSPWLRLFELEKETGFSLRGTLLLQREYLESKSIVEASLQKITSFSNFGNWFRSCTNHKLDAPELAQFYRETFVPNSQKIISLLEKEGDLTALKDIVESYLKFVITMYPLCPPPANDTLPPIITGWARAVFTEYARTQQHPFIQLLPSIAKYASPEAVKLAIQLSDLHLLVLFYCKKAEILAPTDREQAQHYLKQAERTTWRPFWGSLGSSVEELQKSKAMDRIAEVKAKIKP